VVQDSTYQISKNLVTAFIIGLRNLYTDNTKYTYTEDMETTLIEVTDLSPQEVAFFPCVIISSVTGPNSSIYFYDDFLYEIRDDDDVLIGEQHGNQLKLKITLSVYCLTTIAREELTDQTYLYLKTLTSDFADMGVEIRYIEYGTPSTQTIGTRVFHKQTLTVDTYSEWTTTKDIIASERIGSIDVTTTQIIVPFT